jgi:hypothetical protein
MTNAPFISMNIWRSVSEGISRIRYYDPELSAASHRKSSCRAHPKEQGVGSGDPRTGVDTPQPLSTANSNPWMA